MHSLSCVHSPSHTFHLHHHSLTPPHPHTHIHSHPHTPQCPHIYPYFWLVVDDRMTAAMNAPSWLWTNNSTKSSPQSRGTNALTSRDRRDVLLTTEQNTFLHIQLDLHTPTHVESLINDSNECHLWVTKLWSNDYEYAHAHTHIYTYVQCILITGGVGKATGGNSA